MVVLEFYFINVLSFSYIHTALFAIIIIKFNDSFSKKCSMNIFSPFYKLSAYTPSIPPKKILSKISIALTS